MFSYSYGRDAGRKGRNNMSDRILLNDILHLSDEDIERTRVRFNLNDGATDPIEEFKRDPDVVNSQWLLWRNDKNMFTVGQIAICLVRCLDNKDHWLLTTIRHIDADNGVKNGVAYEASDLENYKPLFGRVLVSFHKGKGEQGSVRKFGLIKDELEVIEILPDVYDDDHFPGYDKVCLTFDQLSRIIAKALPDWVAALENQKGVYAIVDRGTGKLYIGSATSDNGGLLQRWRAYADNGHGGNTELKKLVDAQGLEYVRQNFQYVLLENYNYTVRDDEVLRREPWWKSALCTREFGYNLN